MRVQHGLPLAFQGQMQGRETSNVLRPKFGNDNDTFQSMQARLQALEAQLAKKDLSAMFARVVPATATIQVDITVSEKRKPTLMDILKAMVSKAEAPKLEDKQLQKGSGFWIRCKDGKPRLLTNAHVVNYDEKYIRYMLPEVQSFKYSAELNYNRDAQSIATNQKELKVPLRVTQTADGKQAISTKMDLALVEPEDESFYTKKGDQFELPGGIVPLEFEEDASKMPPGTTVYKIGSGSLTRGSIGQGILSAYRKPGSLFETTKDGFTMIESTVPLNQGDSGGPLLNEDGKVLGVNYSIPASGMFRVVQGIGWTIAAADARRMLAEWGMLPDV